MFIVKVEFENASWVLHEATKVTRAHDSDGATLVSIRYAEARHSGHPDEPGVEGRMFRLKPYGNEEDDQEPSIKAIFVMNESGSTIDVIRRPFGVKDTQGD